MFDPKAKTIKACEYQNLVINLDYDDDPSKTFPVLLFTPNLKDTATHYHVTLTRNQAKTLHGWLDNYLKGKI